MDKYNLPNNALSYVFIVFAVLLILRCSNYADKSNENALNIDIKDTISTFSDIFKSVTYIPLETTPNSLIGEPKKLVQYQDKFFILDYQTNSLLIFNMNGKFIKNLCIQGKGPGEVMSIRDFAINAYSNTIEVYDNLLFKILKYNLKGNLLEEKKIEFNSNYFVKFDANRYAFHNNDAWNEEFYNIFITDSNFNIIKKYFKVEMPYTTFSDLNSITENNGEVTFSFIFSNEIYSMDKDDLVPKIKWELNFNNNNVPPEFIQKLKQTKVNNYEEENSLIVKNFNIQNKICSQYGRYIFQLNENNDFLYFKFYPYNKIAYFVHNKQTGDNRIFTRYLNDNITGICVPFYLFYLSGNKLVGLIFPQDIIDKNKANLRNFSGLDKVKPMDNPVIAIYELK